MSNAQLAGHYYTQFQSKKAVIDNLLASPTTTTTAAHEIQAVKRSLTDATPFLPPYDQRRYQDQIKEWERSVGSSGGGDGVVKGKSRFTFKKRVGPSTTAVNGTGVRTEDVAPWEDSTPLQTGQTTPASSSSESPAQPASTQITLRDTNRRRITLADLLADSNESQRTGFSLVLQNVEGCVIDLRDEETTSGRGKRLTALYGTGVKDCVLVAPEDVAGSVMLEGMERVIVVTGCQQFRIHSSTNSILLLRIPSNPIIEHCSFLRFGRYPCSLGQAATSVVSRHREVQDFGWIKPGPSPNFKVLEDVVADQVGAKVESMLRYGSRDGDMWEKLRRLLDEVL